MSSVPFFLKHGFLEYSGRGVAGLWGVLRALERPGADVLMPAGICEIVPATVIHAGMKSVFCDVDPLTGNSNFSHFKESLSKNTVACIAVHNYGTPLDFLDIESIKKWTANNNIFLIEDVCNATGAEINGFYAGAFADAAFYSFGYAKIIDGGGGGALVVKDEALYKKAVQIMAKLPEKSREHVIAIEEFNASLKDLRGCGKKGSHKKIKNLYAKYMPYLIHRKEPDIVEKILDKL